MAELARRGRWDDGRVGKAEVPGINWWRARCRTWCPIPLRENRKRIQINTRCNNGAHLLGGIEGNKQELSVQFNGTVAIGGKGMRWNVARAMLALVMLVAAPVVALAGATA